MNFSKRILSAVLVVVMCVTMLYMGNLVKVEEEKNIFDHAETLHIWYTDEALTDYLGSMAVKFNEEQGIRVIPVLQSGLELLENINAASLSKESTPDLFIATNDIIEKAYLTGLAMPIDNSDGVVGLANFPESAIHAVTYQQEIIGYPFYYETSALLYNKTYLKDMAKKNIEEALKAEDTAQETETKEEQTKEASASDLDKMAEEQIQTMIPTTFEKLLEFADNYDAPENVEAVFKWDVADIFYNYFFAGNYINVGGMCGDNVDAFDLYNEEAIRALMVYQKLSDYFAIDATTVNYNTVIQDFMEGKVVMTTATTDIVGKLEKAKEEGTFTFDYGIATIPRLTEEMETKGMSVTNAIYINGYSPLKAEANDFARYLTIEHGQELYQTTGKVTANKNVIHENIHLNTFMNEYQDSVPIPKIMAASNFPIKMEIMFDRIWEGEEVSAQLKLLSEEMMSQITGQPYEEEYIKVEEEQQEYIEYSQD